MNGARLLFYSLVTLLVLESSHCRVSYGFKGGRKFADTVTVSVRMFENNAPLAKATVPQVMSETLKDAVQRQTKTQLVTSNGDLNFEGSITGYGVTPVAVQGGGGNQSAQNRLTITINVRYTDKVEEKYNFESAFSRFQDFPSSQNLTAVEDQLIRDIAEQLVQDIMNRSINAW